MKGTLTCCKVQVIFKSKRKFSDKFRFKDRAPYYLVLCYFCQFKIGQDQICFCVGFDRYCQKVICGGETGH